MGEPNLLLAPGLAPSNFVTPLCVDVCALVCWYVCICVLICVHLCVDVCVNGKIKINLNPLFFAAKLREVLKCGLQKIFLVN